MKVGITGASGFVGSHVMAAARREDHEVIAFARNPDKMASAIAAHGLADDEVEVVIGQITDQGDVEGFLDRCDAVVHTAGIASVTAIDEALITRTNVDGSRYVLDGAVERGLDPIVHTSSVAALFPPPGDVMTADDPLADSATVYGQTKAAAERIARDHQADGAPVVTFNPGGIVGPIDPGSSDMIEANAMLIDKGVFMLPTGGGNSFIDVRDLATGMVRALEPGQGPRRFMCGGRFTGWDTWIKAIEQASGRSMRIITVPPKVMIGLGASLDAVARVIKKFEPPLSRESAFFMSYAKPTDDTRFHEELGVEYRPLQDTVDDFVEWMFVSGRAKRPN